MTLRFGDEKSLFGQGEVPAIVAALLDKGSAGLTRQQVQDRLDELKTELSHQRAAATRCTVDMEIAPRAPAGGDRAGRRTCCATRRSRPRRSTS